MSGAPAGAGDNPSTPRATWPRWVVTIGGSGMSPVAPGTFGSLAATLLLAAWYVALQRTGTLTPLLWNLSLVGGILIFGALCVALGRWTQAYYGRKDPGACVLDEGAGICLTALFVPIYPGWREAWALALVFALFRLFDVTKIWPAKRLERLPYGWGILTDDLAAAVYANVVCQALVRLIL